MIRPCSQNFYIIFNNLIANNEDFRNNPNLIDSIDFFKEI